MRVKGKEGGRGGISRWRIITEVEEVRGGEGEDTSPKNNKIQNYPVSRLNPVNDTNKIEKFLKDKGLVLYSKPSPSAPYIQT